jgi:hypothetical protein
MKRHELKTWPGYFALIRSGAKPFDVRFNDRGFAVGDTLVFLEFDPESSSYTDEAEEREVSAVLTDTDRFGVQTGYVVLGFKPPEPTGRLRVARALPIEELLAWHKAEAIKAREREQSYTPRPAETSVMVRADVGGYAVDRMAGLALASAEIAAFHEGAVAAVQSLAGRPS